MERDEIDYGRRSSYPSAVYRARIVPLHEVESVVTQTMPPPATETGMMTNDLETPAPRIWLWHVWMLQNFIRSLGANRETLSRMHEARLLIECINASMRYRELGNRLIGEIEEGYAASADLSTIPAQHRGSCVFQSLYWGRAKSFEEHYYALRATVCVCAIAASTAYADCASGAYPKLGASGTTSYYACNVTAGTRTKIYGSPDPTADGGGAFTGSGPGIPSSGGGTLKKRRDCKVSFSIFAFEFANEVVL